MHRHLAPLLVLVALAGCSKPSPTAPKKSDNPADPIAECDAFIAKAGIDKTKPDWKEHLPEPSEFAFDSRHTYYWIVATNVGTIKIKLLPEYAPMHVSSTIYLARLGFYDGLPFHRVIPGFMAQGGDPTGTGMGGPGYKYASEIDTRVRHSKPGLLSMANTGRPRSDGSQFFLTFVPTPHLDGKHTIFGEVVDGMGTVRALEQRGSRTGETSEPLTMTKTSIEAK